MNKIKQEIPIFFSADDNYIPCLSVAIHSLEKNASQDNNYRLIILHSGMSREGKQKIKNWEKENVKISFEDISRVTKKMSKELALRCRDYYSETIYYRMFIPSMFREYEKAIYLDSDIIIQDDIANFFNIDLGDNLLAAVKDEVVNNDKDFIKYSEIALGIDAPRYFNSGVLLMNLREMRKANIENRFVYLLLKYNLDTIAPDQDYLNVLCKDRVMYLPETWDKMPDFGRIYPAQDLHIIHYNMYRKPWHYLDVPYSECFWEYAKETQYYEELKEELENYPEDAKKADMVAGANLIEYSKKIVKQEIKLIDVIDETNDEEDVESGIAQILAEGV